MNSYSPLNISHLQTPNSTFSNYDPYGPDPSASTSRIPSSYQQYGGPHSNMHSNAEASGSGSGLGHRMDIDTSPDKTGYTSMNGNEDGEEDADGDGEYENRGNTSSEAPEKSTKTKKSGKGKKEKMASGSVDGSAALAEGKDQNGRNVVIKRSARPAVQACQHCHQRKRKCDRLQPTCTNCLRAKKACVFDMKLSERAAPEYIASLLRSVQESTARVQALESLLKKTEPSKFGGIEEVATDRVAELGVVIGEGIGTSTGTGGLGLKGKPANHLYQQIQPQNQNQNNGGMNMPIDPALLSNQNGTVGGTGGSSSQQFQQSNNANLNVPDSSQNTCVNHIISPTQYIPLPAPPTQTGLSSSRSIVALTPGISSRNDPSGGSAGYRLTLARGINGTGIGSTTGGNGNGKAIGIPASGNYNGKGMTGAEEMAALPPYATSMSLINAYFTNTAVAYPFLDKAHFLRELHQAYDPAESNPTDPAAIRARKLIFFRLFLILAIGTCHVEQLNLAPTGTSVLFFEKAMQSLDAVLLVEDINCIQSLLLLALYAMYDVDGPSIWSTLGLAVRMALGLGLHKKIDRNAPGGRDENFLDMRRRVFWSLFNFDRMLSFTLGRPQAIHDEDIDIEVPSINSPSSDPLTVRVLQQAIIRGRRLGGVIQRALYRPGQVALSPQEAATFVPSLTTQCQNWYDETILYIQETQSTTDKNAPPIWLPPSWFDLTLHMLLCSLHRPSPGCPEMTVERFTVLRETSSKTVVLFTDLVNDRRIAFNHIYLLQIFTGCSTLLFCLSEYEGNQENMLSAGWRREALRMIGICDSLLNSFAIGWPGTARYRSKFKELSTSFTQACESADAQEQKAFQAAISEFANVPSLGFEDLGFQMELFDWAAFDTLTEDFIGRSNLLEPTGFENQFGG